METKITQEWIFKAAEDHKLWLITGGKKGTRLELRDVVIEGEDLSGIDLSRAILESVSIRHSSLHSCLMSGVEAKDIAVVHCSGDVNFDGATVEGLRIFYTTLPHSSFVGASIRQDFKIIRSSVGPARFDCSTIDRMEVIASSISRSSFQMARICTLIAEESEMYSSCFINAEAGASFSRCLLSESDFRLVKSEVKFHKCSLDGALFDGVNPDEEDIITEVKDHEGKDVVLRIPAGARKIRVGPGLMSADFAEVIRVYSDDGSPAVFPNTPRRFYQEGSIICPYGWNTNLLEDLGGIEYPEEGEEPCQ